MDVLDAVRRALAEFGVVAAEDRAIVVGVSGGPDSLCLLHTLWQLRPELGLRLHVAHLNHGSRGAEADADAEYVARTAAAWDVPATVERRDVPALAAAHGLAFEEAARRMRYAFLARVAGEVGAHAIAVGHNADDQAETVLMHFLRGSGLAGLRGMLPCTPITDYRLLEPFGVPETGSPTGDLCILRPLLEVPRAEIETYVEAHGLQPRFDRSNLDMTHFRNRLRHELLPILETYNPEIRTRLRHTAAVLAADHELLEAQRERAWTEVVCVETPQQIVFDLARWRVLPLALQRALLREAAYRLRATLRDVDFVHVDNAVRLVQQGGTGKRATLPMGLEVLVSYNALLVGPAGGALPPPSWPLLASGQVCGVPVPGRLPLPGGWTLEVTAEGWVPGAPYVPGSVWTAVLDADAVTGPLALRTRRRGDRFAPQGMDGRRVKLSDYLINRKVPQGWRDRLPLLVLRSGGTDDLEDDEILWVCGFQVSERVVVRPATNRVLRLVFARTP